MSKALTDVDTNVNSRVERLTARIRGILGNPVLRKSLMLALLLYLSPVVGVVLEIAMIRMLGTGSVLDAFRVLTTFMMMGQGVITSQLLKYALVPQLAWFRHQGRDRGGLRFALYFTALVVTMLSPVWVVGLFWPEHLLYFLAPGFDAETVTSASGLVRVAATGLIVLTVVGAMSAVMNFYGTFWGQPLGQVLSNVLILLAVVLLGGYATGVNEQFTLLQISVATGLLLMLSIQLVQCVRIWRSTGADSSASGYGDQFKLVFLMLVPQLVIIASEVIKPVAVNRTLSQMAVGSIVLYMLAFRLQMIGNLPAKALITVLFPDLSRLRHQATSAHLLARLRNGVLQILLLTGVISAGLWLMAEPIVTGIGLLGKISEEQVSLVLALYQVFLLFAPFGAVGLYCMETAFAYRQTGLVVSYSVINTAAILFMLPAALEKGVVAVAVAYTLSQALCMMLLGVALYIQIRRKTSVPEAPAS